MTLTSPSTMPALVEVPVDDLSRLDDDRAEVGAAVVDGLRARARGLRSERQRREK
jgi:hypothetical protein